MNSIDKLRYKINENIKRYGRNNAIITETKTLTYIDFENEINKICNTFDRLGVKDGDCILIICEDSILNILLIIACIYYKVIFIPIDICLEPYTIQQYIYAANAKWIICSESNRIEIENYENVLNGNCFNIFVSVSSDNLYFDREKDACYIYFTSGSTGTPKGVVGTRTSLLHFIEWEIREFKINHTYKCSQLTPIMFDPYLRDILVPLCSGGSICIPELNTKIKIDRLANWLIEKQITMIHIVPSLFRQLLSYLAENNFLKYVFLAGEKVLRKDVSLFYSWNSNYINLVNLYGPTETTLAKFYYRISRDDIDKDNIPVGKAIDENTYCIIKDSIDIENSNEKLGEIYISTQYVSLGYLIDHKLVQDIFVKDDNCLYNYIYKTGDIGKLNNKGELIVVGRCDNQIKINGKKLQIEKVEEMIKEEFNGLNLAIVCVGEINKVLFIIIEENKIELKDSVKEYVKTILYYFKLPVKVIAVDKIPYNRNGKIDRIVLKEICIKSITSKKSKNDDEEDFFTKKILSLLASTYGELCPSVDDKIIDVFDSLSYISFLVQIENEYHLELEDDLLDIKYFNTISDIIQYIMELVGE